MKIKKNILFFIMMHASLFSSSAYDTVIDNYAVALQDLIKVHTKKNQTKGINLSSGSLTLVTYKKIITPYAMYINGWANIAINSFQQHGEYLKHLQKAQDTLKQYNLEVEQIINYFPAANHDELQAIFYELIGSDVVDGMFNIVQTLSNNAVVDSYDLKAAFIAYQLAHQLYQKDMKIRSIGQGLDFTTTLVENMRDLYANALVNLQNKLSIGNLGQDSIKTIYAQMVSYNEYLEQVYNDIQDQQTALVYKTHKEQAAACYSQYKAAQKDYQALQTSLQSNKVVPTLEVQNVQATTTQLQTVATSYDQNKTSAASIQIQYQQAQDIFAAGMVEDILDQLNINLLIVQALDQLWLLYLQDQSSNSLYTAPSIASFISQANQNSSNPVTNDQVVSALQNLSNLLTQSSNSISALSSNSNLAAYSIQDIIKLIQKNFLALEQKGEKLSGKDNYLLVSIISITTSLNILFYLNQLVNSLVAVLTNTDSNAVSLAYVYQYSKQLDGIYQKLSVQQKKEMNLLFPFLPNQVAQAGLTNESDHSWTNWSEQIMLASGVVNSSDIQGAKTQKVTIKSPAIAKKVSNDQLSSMTRQAHDDAVTLNFDKASKGYYGLYELYSNLYEVDPTNTEYVQKMELIKTLYTATSFASKIQESGTPKTWQQISQIPQEYQITQYQFQNISVADFGLSQLPASLMTIPLASAYTSLSAQQQKDGISLIKAYVINQLFENQGINFTDIFTDYTLTKNPSADPQALAQGQKIIDQVQNAFNDFKGVSVSSITLSDASTIQAIVCDNLVIPSVKPLFGSMATALTFFSSAELLFAPSSKSIQLGSSSYVSGNDQQLTEIMIEQMVYAYLCAGLNSWNKAQQEMQQVLKTLPKASDASQVLPDSFSTSLNLINKNLTAAQAMLYAQGQSAFAYASQLKDSSLASQVQAIFFDTYKEFISWMKKCLIGSPYQQSYHDLMMTISKSYINWSSWLDPQKDSEQIAQNISDNIALLTTAGDTCMNTSYTQPLYPSYQQKHYAAAANYYQAAYNEYVKNSDTANAAKVQKNIFEAYFKGINQSVDIFLHTVLVQGVYFTHEETNQQQQISFSELIQDSQSGFSSIAEQKAFTSVKNLLLHAGMGLTFLINKIKPKTTSQKTKKQKII